jgi:hypothetical protein
MLFGPLFNFFINCFGLISALRKLVARCAKNGLKNGKLLQ